MKRVLGWWIGRTIDLRDRRLWAARRCSWCQAHGFACGGDVHAIASAAMELAATERHEGVR